MSSLSGINSLQSSQYQAGDNGSVSIPTNLTPAEEAQVEQILGELSSGSITAAQAQAEIASVTSGQQQSVQGSAPATGVHHHHGHHEEVAGLSPQTLSSALDLTTDQESQIATIVQNAQKDGSAPASVLSQIESVLTPAQQQKLAQLLSPTYSSVGTSATGTQPPLFSTTA